MNAEVCTGRTHGSSALVRAPLAVQLRHAFLRRVRDAPAERPKPVDMSVLVRHEYHSKTPAYLKEAREGRSRREQ